MVIRWGPSKLGGKRGISKDYCFVFGRMNRIKECAMALIMASSSFMKMPFDLFLERAKEQLLLSKRLYSSGCLNLSHFSEAKNVSTTRNSGIRKEFKSLLPHMDDPGKTQ